ncbi:hypothetical protein BUALT_Bualt05G0164400 [Buddleja alternifolia]|uniref:Eukaryotic translation initiation factor 4B n=1 Tax=Buddleja alternifolia TaxID=168488 RepID=A0AAV6XJN9_9LAMI|nr:hypothetical protein BUALT_Bualt05G0164400 [Buddleja alternifolia]
MSKSPWGNIGNWAAEAERAEAEELEAAAAAAAQPPLTFPSLKESVTTAKQKKKTKMTLLEFTMQQSAAAAPSRGLTHDEMLRLPTGPKERSADEMQTGRLGGGFSNYGSRNGSNSGREGRRSYGFEDDDRKGGGFVPRDLELNQPSRADEVDNWGSMKKQTLPDYNSGQARPVGRYGSLGGGGGSRADEVDNWGSGKKPISGFGSGYSRPEPDRWARGDRSFGSEFSRPESDRWGRNEQRLVVEAPKMEGEVVVKVNKPNPFGAARPREEVLLEKGLDWKKLDLEIEAKKTNSVSGGSRPTSSHSSRPESAHSSRSEVPMALAGGDEGVKQKPKVNPFGDAKPREVLLEQKGLDWKKLDRELEQRQVERPETEEEKKLKEEIEHLKKESLQKSGEDQTSINDMLLQRERDLELLTRQLDDKVRYSRPGSGSGRGDRPPSRSGPYEDPKAGFHDRRPGSYEESRASYTERPPSRPGIYEDSRAGFPERPPSRPGAYEEPRGSYPQRSSSFMHGAHQEQRAFDHNERPRSRGTVNSWTRPSDDRRAFQGGGGRGFSGGRDVDRYLSLRSLCISGFVMSLQF